MMGNRCQSRWVVDGDISDIADSHVVSDDELGSSFCFFLPPPNERLCHLCLTSLGGGTGMTDGGTLLLDLIVLAECGMA